MRRLLLLPMLGFVSVVGLAATSAPVPGSSDCSMMIRNDGLGGEQVGCWVGPCDSPRSVCTWTTAVINGLPYAWCVCSGSEPVGECAGHAVQQGGVWWGYCGSVPCLLGTGVCHPNAPLALPVWVRACSCLYLPPVY